MWSLYGGGATTYTASVPPRLPSTSGVKDRDKSLRGLLFAFNLISDSAYVVNAVKMLEAAGPIKASSPVCLLFQQLQNLIWCRKIAFI